LERAVRRRIPRASEHVDVWHDRGDVRSAVRAAAEPADEIPPGFPERLIDGTVLGGGQIAVRIAVALLQSPPHLRLDRRGRGFNDLGLRLFRRHAFWRAGLARALWNARGGRGQ